MTKLNRLLLILILLAAGNAVAQKPLPKIVKNNGRHTLLMDGKPFFILGGQIHNLSAWPGMMPQIWRPVEKMHGNTLQAPVYWEQLEPRQGYFDFSMINTLLIQARHIVYG